jgi:trehalose 6-phosphate phosphatase
MHLLSPPHSALLSQLASGHTLLAFDFDGTLAPIVDDRELARMREPTAQLLSHIARSFPCAVISGRSQGDVSARLGSAQVRYVVGNHGLEPNDSMGEFARQIAAARPVLQAALAAEPGVEIEDKRFSLSIHYRAASDRARARQAVEAAVAALGSSTRSMPGKLVVNILPALAPHKGHALLRLRALEGATCALYVGDDVTDEDVFELDQPERLVSVRVGDARYSAARYFLRDQLEIDQLLSLLIELRARPAE